MNKDIFKWIALGGLFLIPFIPFLVSASLFFPFITTKAFAWRAIIEIVFASWLVLAALKPEFRPKRSAILYAFFTFIFIIGLADAFGVAPVKSFWSNFERMEGFVTMLHLGAMFVVLGSVFKENEWRWWWNTNLVASFIMVLYCTSQLLGISAIHQGGVRVDGTFGNAAYLAVYMLINIFIALFFFVQTKSNSMLRWTYGILIFLQTVILYETATRGAILGLLGGLLLIALLNIRNQDSKMIRKASIGTILGILALIGGFFLIRNTSFVKSSEVLARFSSISPAELKTEGRSFVWPMALKGIKEHPLLGWGQENFNYVFNKNYDPKMFRLEPWFDRAHNIFLDWGVAGGLLGLLSYLSLYVLFLWVVWKKSGFSYLERSILTGLLAAYFFHNLFVFDHLLSYILFVSLLAYLHAKAVRSEEEAAKVGMTETKAYSFVLAPVLVTLVAILYVLNIKPYIANENLIHALQIAQSNGANKAEALSYFKAAYNGSRLGRPEVVEWISTSADNVLGSDISTEDKNTYFTYAKEVIIKQADMLSTDARYQLVAGSFLSKTGFPDEALTYLKRARDLSPGKQSIYFEIGGALIAKKDYKEALKVFKEASELAPDYEEGRLIYLVGAIYANDAQTVNTLLATLPSARVANDDRVAGALLSTGRFTDLENLLKTRIQLDPKNAQGYISLAAAYLKAGDKTNAIKALQLLGVQIPDSKAQADQYIQGIQNGTIK